MGTLSGRNLRLSSESSNLQFPSCAGVNANELPRMKAIASPQVNLRVMDDSPYLLHGAPCRQDTLRHGRQDNQCNKRTSLPIRASGSKSFVKYQFMWFSSSKRHRRIG
jgi:hypothetical protein